MRAYNGITWGNGWMQKAEQKIHLQERIGTLLSFSLFLNSLAIHTLGCLARASRLGFAARLPDYSVRIIGRKQINNDD